MKNVAGCLARLWVTACCFGCSTWWCQWLLKGFPTISNGLDARRGGRRLVNRFVQTRADTCHNFDNMSD